MSQFFSWVPDSFCLSYHLLYNNTLTPLFVKVSNTIKNRTVRNPETLHTTRNNVFQMLLVVSVVDIHCFRARMFVQLGLGGMRRWRLLVQSSLSPDGCQASTHALLMSTASASPALLFVLVVLQAGGLSLSCRIPGLGMVCVFTPQGKSPPISSFFSS